MLLQAERKLVIDYCLKLNQENLTRGSSGNISIRNQNHIAISPSGMEYNQLKPEDIVIVDIEGNILEGKRKPSSELAFHLALYQKRENIKAVVHTHSIHATALACLGEELPAAHYMIGFAGDKVPLVPYQTFGTDKLAQAIQEKLENYNALLLENHGLLAVGENIKDAYTVAHSVEFVAEVYLKARSAGTPKILSTEEMSIIQEKFKTYGK